jgi:alkanesulfonate monooxygenase SsuD/methylene tetrahydromethanopterin reductase-like flavin-dependent oxidoreductase (luciferase family)
MKFGVAIFPTESVQPPSEIAAMAEERGFECLLFPEHTHIPACRETPAPSGEELPSHYSRTYDPFVALTAAALATERLLIGTGICLVIERDPIITAKEVASIDVLSGGRFLFGVGAGWNAEEMRNHGTDPSRRFSLMRERIEAMKAIFTQDEGSRRRADAGGLREVAVCRGLVAGGEHLQGQRRPREVDRAHPATGERVVVLAQPARPDGRGDARRQHVRL